MRIVVTGASGNLGTALLRRLDGTGHDVVAVARRTPDHSGPVPTAHHRRIDRATEEDSDLPHDAAALAFHGGRLTWVPLDLSDPRDVLRLPEVLHGADACVHLAWALQPMQNRGHQRRTNLGGSAVCLGAAAEVGVSQAVVASSVAAYSPRRDRGLVDESYPTRGIPGVAYSHDKVVLEGVIRDVGERARGRLRIATIRPALLGQRAVGGQLLRIGLPVLTPPRLLRHLPFLLIDRAVGLQTVHSDDVADAVVRILEQERAGPFNLVADPVLGHQQVAAAFGARPVHLPWRVTRAVAAAAYRARLQPLDPGWIEMAHRVPWASARRAREELGWEPAHSAQSVLEEVIQGASDGVGGATAPLRPHDVGEELARTVRDGPVSHRPLT